MELFLGGRAKKIFGKKGGCYTRIAVGDPKKQKTEKETPEACENTKEPWERTI